ncbi:MAG TPA: acyl-CoA dehydrogenase family protein [Nitrososphaerales archaeon]|nr:acyl-CoA dehydrogenase family protein [Nitrososphaerales archaeon]
MDLAYDDSGVALMRDVSSEFDVSYWRDVSKEHRFPSEYRKAIAKSGLFGILVEKRWGGMERGLVDLALATQETAERYAGIGSYLYLSGSLTPMIFAANTTKEWKEKMMPAFAKGELIVSIALAEESSGLDALSIETTAKSVSDHFVISGRKMFVTNADIADFLLLFARTGPRGGRKSGGISMFLVDSKDPTIKKSKLEKLGLDFNTIHSVEVRDLKVSQESMVGPPGEAWKGIREVFLMDRILTSASLVGTGKLSVQQAAEYASKRSVFGKPIGSNQGVQFPLADAVIHLLAAEAMVLKAASRIDQKTSFEDEANFALLESANAAQVATDRALQALGGHGYLRDYDQERYWRDVRVHRLHPITEELLLATIAEKCLGLPKSY